MGLTESILAEIAVLKAERDTYKAAFLARFATQNHHSGCLHCQGTHPCARGAKLKNEASIAEEKAGELE